MIRIVPAPCALASALAMIAASVATAARAEGSTVREVFSSGSGAVIGEAVVTYTGLDLSKAADREASMGRVEEAANRLHNPDLWALARSGRGRSVPCGEPPAHAQAAPSSSASMTRLTASSRR